MSLNYSGGIALDDGEMGRESGWLLFGRRTGVGNSPDRRLAVINAPPPPPKRDGRKGSKAARWNNNIKSSRVKYSGINMDEARGENI